MIKRRVRKKYYKKKNPVTVKKVLIALAALAAAAGLAAAAYYLWPEISDSAGERYIAGSSADVELYYYDDYDSHLLKSSETIVRGTEVRYTGEDHTENGQTFSIIEYDGAAYYVDHEYLVKSPDDIVKETEKWVRTSVTVYKNNEDSQIESFIKKGEQVNITGYDTIGEDGAVSMYEIECDGITGWVYAKYLADSRTEANEVYEDVYYLHKDREFTSELYGGSTEDLDWYPYEKPEFEDNELLAEARSMYITGDAVANIDDYLDLAEESGVNSVVLNIKDTYLTTKFDTAAELSPSANKNVCVSEEVFAEAVQKIKDAGLYIIARIVVFNDSYYSADHPEDTIETDVTTTAWVSAYSRDAWYYNVALAEEVIEKYGVNEIQFDYIRFPDTAYRMSLDESTDFKNTYNESKAEAIQNFLYYACDQIHKYGVYVSADVFGESAYRYVTAYGQYWAAISNVVDVISGMPYTDHFGNNDTWSDPYSTLSSWAESVNLRQSEIETPALVRTWITGYDVPLWNPYVECDADYATAQIQALYDAGITGGFMIWNGASNLSKYQQISPAWSY